MSNKIEFPALVFNGFENFPDQPMPKEAYKIWTETLQILQFKLEEAGITGDEAVPYILKKLEGDDFKSITKKLISDYLITEDEDYFKIIYQIYDVIKWCDSANTQTLEEHISIPLYDVIFNEIYTDENKDKYNKLVNLIKKELTPALIFNGKRMTIEEYMELSNQVRTMDLNIFSHLFFTTGTMSGKTIESGLFTQEEIFCIKTGTMKMEDIVAKKRNK